MPTQKRLRELFYYDPDTGIVTRIKSVPGRFGKAGRIAGTRQPRCYALCVDCKIYRMHRLIWMYVYGSIPKGYEIDHIDHDFYNNRLSNLRCVTHYENILNTSRRTDNKAGWPGVCYATRDKHWMAYIDYNGKRTYLGRFKSRGAAISARKAAQKELPFHSNHGLPMAA